MSTETHFTDSGSSPPILPAGQPCPFCGHQPGIPLPVEPLYSLETLQALVPATRGSLRGLIQRNKDKLAPPVYRTWAGIRVRMYPASDVRVLRSLIYSHVRFPKAAARARAAAQARGAVNGHQELQGNRASVAQPAGTSAPARGGSPTRAEARSAAQAESRGRALAEVASEAVPVRYTSCPRCAARVPERRAVCPSCGASV